MNGWRPELLGFLKLSPFARAVLASRLLENPKRQELRHRACILRTEERPMGLFQCKQDGPASTKGQSPTKRKQRVELGEAKQQQNGSIWSEIDGLRHQTLGQLRVKYREVFGQESRSNHKQFLVRRIAWRLQANAEGDLSERARQRALALAQETELRIRAPESFMRELPGATGKWPAQNGQSICDLGRLRRNATRSTIARIERVRR